MDLVKYEFWFIVVKTFKNLDRYNANITAYSTQHHGIGKSISNDGTSRSKTVFPQKFDELMFKYTKRDKEIENSKIIFNLRLLHSPSVVLSIVMGDGGRGTSTTNCIINMASASFFVFSFHSFFPSSKFHFAFITPQRWGRAKLLVNLILLCSI